jgi:hypothetical protein
MQLALIDDAKIFNDKLREWEDCDNYHLPTSPTAASAAKPPTNDSEPNPHPGVTDDHQLHKSHWRQLQTFEPPVGIEPTTYALREPFAAATVASTSEFVHAVGLRDINKPTGRREFAPHLMSQGS